MAEGKGLSVPKNPALALRELNRRHATPAAPPPDSPENTTVLQTDKQTDLPTALQTHQPTNILTDTPTDKHTDLPTNKPTDPQTNKLTRTSAAWPDSREREEPAVEERPRVDGRTLRSRQATADRTMVTSFRLSVETLNRIDDLCWKHRMRKGDVVQAALDMYLNSMLGEDGE